jgi:asparagine synthase (glutamine-hydrolysing)
MLHSIRHRGPDDEGVHIAEGIAIGVRRLSIMDVADGHQPMWNDRATVIAAQNGELYNYRSVRSDLEARGHRFSTTCDTEILPALYDEAGDAAPERLNGMFAFVIWDDRRRRAVLARDHVGIKPLYYAEVGDLLLFGSELKCLLASGLVSTEIDVESLELLLSLGFVPGPRTILRDVKKLPPGHRIVVEPPRVRVERYWAYPEPAPVQTATDDEWEAQLLELLDDAVGLQLMSDVPLGAMLSGGIDSSLIVALMAQRMDRPVKTFSVGFAGMPDNELATARRTAQALGSEHHELELSLDAAVDLESLAWTMDEPVADLSAIGFMALAGLTAEHVTVALSGQGADELLAGYDRYRSVAALDRWTALPAPIRRAGAAAARRASPRLRLAGAVAGARDPVVAAVIARSDWATDRRRDAAVGDLAGVPASLLEQTLADRLGHSRSRGVDRALLLDGQLNLVDDMLHYFDRTSMAHSLEVRVPYLDHRVVELCARMPTHLKISRGMTKRILRTVARGRVPDEVIDRPKIGFFSSAVDAWFGRQQGVVREILLQPNAKYTDFVSRRAIEDLIADGTSYRRSKLLLSVLMLELWLSAHTGATVPAAAGAVG